MICPPAQITGQCMKKRTKNTLLRSAKKARRETKRRQLHARATYQSKQRYDRGSLVSSGFSPDPLEDKNTENSFSYPAGEEKRQQRAATTLTTVVAESKARREPQAESIHLHKFHVQQTTIVVLAVHGRVQIQHLSCTRPSRTYLSIFAAGVPCRQFDKNASLVKPRCNTASSFPSDFIPDLYGTTRQNTKPSMHDTQIMKRTTCGRPFWKTMNGRPWCRSCATRPKLLMQHLSKSLRVEPKTRQPQNHQHTNARRRTKPAKPSPSKSAPMSTVDPRTRVEPLQLLPVLDRGFAVLEMSLQRPHPLRQRGKLVAHGHLELVQELGDLVLLVPWAVQ